MNKRYLQVILIIALGFIFQENISFAQDSAKIKSSDEFTALKKGNYAIYLEFGSLIFRSASDNSYSEWWLTAKYHLSDKTALRFSGGTDLNHQTGIYNRYDNGTHVSWTNNGNNSLFNTTVNIQHFLSLKSKIKPFFSLGVYANYDYHISSYPGYWSKTEEWGIGPFASFGAEMFVLDNISIIGEYILKGTAGKRYQKSIYYEDNNFTTSEDYSYLNVYKLDLKSFRAGLSIYF
jgi:hypothetical protein